MNTSEDFFNRIKRVAAGLLIERIENETSVERIVEGLKRWNTSWHLGSGSATVRFKSKYYGLVERVMVG